MVNVVSFSKYIRLARLDSGFSQQKMAKALNLARQTYLDMENGKVCPRADRLMRIAEVTQKPITYFYGLGDGELVSDWKRLISSVPDGKKAAFFRIMESVSKELSS